MRHLVIALVLVSGCAHTRRAEPGADGSWLVAVNGGGWFDTAHQNSGGIAYQAHVAKAIRPHVLLGGRGTAVTEINIGDTKNTGHLVDVGPTVTTAGNLSRLSASVSAGPMLTNVKYDAGGWKQATTIGLGLDASIAVRITGGFGIGVHALENFNPEQSVTGFALRFEGSMQ